MSELGQQRPAPKLGGSSFFSATLTALKEKKTGIRFIDVGEIIRRFCPKGIAKEAAFEAVEFFREKQLGAVVRGGAESIVHATEITFEK